MRKVALSLDARGAFSRASPDFPRASPGGFKEGREVANFMASGGFAGPCADRTSTRRAAPPVNPNHPFNQRVQPRRHRPPAAPRLTSAACSQANVPGQSGASPARAPRVSRRPFHAD